MFCGIVAGGFDLSWNGTWHLCARTGEHRRHLFTVSVCFDIGIYKGLKPSININRTCGASVPSAKIPCVIHIHHKQPSTKLQAGTKQHSNISANFPNCRHQGKSLASLNAGGTHQQKRCYFSLSALAISRLMLYWPYVHFCLTPDQANTERVSKLLTRDGGNYSFGCQVPEHLHSSKWWYWYILLVLQSKKASWSIKKS